jgi:hypothetical protein
MSYWDMFDDPWATIDEQIDRAQAAAASTGQTLYDYSPVGLAQSAYENAPSRDTMLQTLDDYTYTPWEAANDYAEFALETLNPANLIPDVNWKKVGIVAGLLAVSGVGIYMMVRR